MVRQHSSSVWWSARSPVSEVHATLISSSRHARNALAARCFSHPKRWRASSFVSGGGSSAAMAATSSGGAVSSSFHNASAGARNSHSRIPSLKASSRKVPMTGSRSPTGQCGSHSAVRSFIDHRMACAPLTRTDGSSSMGIAADERSAQVSLAQEVLIGCAQNFAARRFRRHFATLGAVGALDARASHCQGPAA